MPPVSQTADDAHPDRQPQKVIRRRSSRPRSHHRADRQVNAGGDDDECDAKGQDAVDGRCQQNMPTMLLNWKKFSEASEKTTNIAIRPPKAKTF
jgi:hypothetical protein